MATPTTSPAPVRLAATFCTDSVLGRFGLGGPGLYTARALRRVVPNALIIARDVAPGAGIAASDCRLVRPAWWRRTLRGTRFHALQLRPQELDRLEFDRKAARVLTPSALVIGENSTSRATFERARSLGARTILLQHNPPFRRMRAELEIERQRWGGPPPIVTERLIEQCDAELLLADAVVTFSARVARELVEEGVPEERVVRAQFGVDCDRFRPRGSAASSDAENGAKSDTARRGFTVVSVGWLNTRKGYPDLVTAFRDAHLPAARLRLHGGSNDRFHHDLVARLRGDADVAVVRGPVVDTLAEADVFVLPSVSEGFGLAALEAMACGLPVVVTDHCGVAQNIVDGENGFIVPARDPAALGEVLGRLTDPEVRAAVGRAARATAESLSWESYEERVGTICAGYLPPSAPGGVPRAGPVGVPS